MPCRSTMDGEMTKLMNQCHRDYWTLFVRGVQDELTRAAEKEFSRYLYNLRIFRKNSGNKISKPPSRKAPLTDGRVDEERIKEVGPERACAEWLLKNGASVRWKGVNEYLSDYNSLAINGGGKLSQHIQAVDATESSISHVGFPYFAGCKYIDEIKLIKCGYIENEALRRLIVIEGTLKHLEVLDCDNITDAALKSLKNLKNLRTLKLRGMPYVKDKSGVEMELAKALPDCKIHWA